MALDDSGPNGPHSSESEAEQAPISSGTGGTQSLEDDGSGPNGPHIVSVRSGPNGPHFLAATADSGGGAMALEDDGSGPNGPH